MGRRKKTEFEESLQMNMSTYYCTLNRLINIALSRFEWVGMPNSVNTRYLELTLLRNGVCGLFQDDVVGIVALPILENGTRNIYDEPTSSIAYAVNGYQKTINDNDSVLIYDNMGRTSNMTELENTARRIMNIERAIDTNINVQKTPYIITCDENERLSMLNLYKELDGNAPIIKGTDKLSLDSVRVLNLNPPYIADKLHEMKSKLWNDAMCNLGVANNVIEKKERLIRDEVNMSMGGTLANRWSYLHEREEACEKINKMFGLNVSVRFRDESEPGGVL